ncbi:phage recombination protein Bet [Candidatus Methylomicrobium oryzae]|uniref:phage recombination protein Bet n=1 Tax=Candidatus Methylomicrobium oryzae TaxID=2802053 RepID=UPI001922E74F|nr:phage recombination protein Bet [Methylomicrobium sp. RS1]MBL1263526.1 phage recombination protein Bet [Methylomicrobium sp. RS1]
MSYPSKNTQPKTRNLPMPADAHQVYGLSEQSWKVLTEVTFPTAKTPEAIMMALDYCRARKLDIFKKPVHIVPMWSTALGRNVETVWPSIMEIQTTATRTGLWAGMDRPVWGPDVTHTFTGKFKDDTETWQESTVTVTFPEWVAVTVYRLVGGRRCAFTEEVYWMEAYSTAGGKNSQLPTAMWIKRPKGQLGKCGKAASLRAAFPEECGYAAEEMDGKSLDELNDGAVINGSASRLDAVDVDTDADTGPRVIDLSMISPKVQKAVAELVRRTAMAGAWKAAYDYANNKFAGLELTYAITELDKASQAAKATSNAFDPGNQTIDEASMPPVSTVASEALHKARETLGSLR